MRTPISLAHMTLEEIRLLAARCLSNLYTEDVRLIVLDLPREVRLVIAETLSEMARTEGMRP